MEAEEQAFRALTLLVAVCEQAILALSALDPPAEGPLATTAERLRDLATEELRTGRLAGTPKGPPGFEPGTDEL